MSKSNQSVHGFWIRTVKTILRHSNCFPSSVAIDDKDGNGLKLEKLGPIYPKFNAMPSKIINSISSS